MRESIKGEVEANPFLQFVVAAIAVLLMLTVNIWGPVLEWLLRRRDQYRNWRGVEG